MMIEDIVMGGVAIAVGLILLAALSVLATMVMAGDRLRMFGSSDRTPPPPPPTIEEIRMQQRRLPVKSVLEKREG